MSLRKRIESNLAEFQILISKSNYFSDIIKYYKCKNNGGVRKIIRSIIIINNIKIDHFRKTSPRKYLEIEKICPNCNILFKTLKNSPKEKTTCSIKCSNFFFKRHTSESKIKISNSLKGRIRSDETKKKISISFSKKRIGKTNLKKRILIDNFYFSNKKCPHCDQFKNIKKGKSICEDCKFQYYFIYRPNCEFKFKIFDYPNEFDTNLIKVHGFYSPVNKLNNPKGISRDHLYSVNDGFKNKIDPNIIKHPSNCRLILNTENQKKHNKSIISLDELIKKN